MGTTNTVKVTYDLLYECLRREQDRGELQKLDPGFWNDVAAYVMEKQDQLLATMGRNDMFSTQERDKLMTQIRHAKNIICELFDRRESKMIQTALNKSRTNSPIIQDTNLLGEEKVIYYDIVKLLGDFRKSTLSTVLEGSLHQSVLSGPVQASVVINPVQNATQNPAVFVTPGITIKFVASVPKFVGKELEVYGPYEKEQVTALPLEIANVLITNGSAVRV
ncbi:MAG: hypothetical protein AABX52_00940 [Nanoarchaeota archaeon]